MELENTTEINTDDIANAREDFESAFDESNTVFMVILGDDDAAKTVAEEAARGVEEGGIQGTTRKAIWIKDKAALANEIKNLEAGAADISNEDLSEVVAFSVSPAKAVMYIIKSTDEGLELRVERAFLKAEEEEEGE